MGANLAELMLQIKPDPWRVNAKFSPELDAVNEVLWRGIDDSTAIEEISSWLHHHQPCLFGRIAAKACQLAFCFIRESDISKGDAYVRDKIQNARLEWTREAFYGRSSGFIIMILSRGVAQALPNDTIKNLAIRLCSLYLLEDIEVDRVFVDRLWLEVPGPAKRTWEWKVGVNYFSSQGDQRWWHDHRIPGGMAFSMNSVGHFVKSGLLAKGMRGLEQSLNFDSAMWEASKIDSLQRALELAMRTIDGAAETESGRATELLDLPLSDQILTDSSSFIRLPKDLTSKNHHNYLGHYHTDHTLPSSYFREDVARPKDIEEHVLDFTYLFHRSIDNPDHETMGIGRPIRGDGEPMEVEKKRTAFDKFSPKLRILDQCDRLATALRST